MRANPMRPPPPAAVLLALAAGATAAAAQRRRRSSNGDAKGAAMVAKDCDACHVRRFGDAPAVYTRTDRRVNTPAQLKAQVSYCNAELGTDYFPDEEEHIAAYLEPRVLQVQAMSAPGPSAGAPSAQRGE